MAKWKYMVLISAKQYSREENVTKNVIIFVKGISTKCSYITQTERPSENQHILSKESIIRKVIPVKQTMEPSVIWDAIALIMTSL